MPTYSSYESQNQLRVDQRDVNRTTMTLVKNVFEKVLVYSAQAAKFIILFTIDALKSVLGRK